MFFVIGTHAAPCQIDGKGNITATSTLSPWYGMATPNHCQPLSAYIVTNLDGAKKVGTPFWNRCLYQQHPADHDKLKRIAIQHSYEKNEKLPTIHQQRTQVNRLRISCWKSEDTTVYSKFAQSHEDGGAS